MEDYIRHIGEWYERDTDSCDKSIFQITGVSDKGFVATAYYITLGYSVITINAGFTFEILHKNNFHKISEDEAYFVKCCCLDPYVCEWKNGACTYYQRIGNTSICITPAQRIEAVIKKCNSQM